MKRLLVFILILANSFFSKSLACYFYPYGEDIRFSIYNPSYFQSLNGFMRYNYCYTHYYYENSDFSNTEGFFTENDLAWYDYCRKQEPISEIKEAVFGLDIDDFKANSNNAFVKYLYKTRDQEAIDYLLFAKKIESIKGNPDDLWENNNDLLNNERLKCIKIAQNSINHIKQTIIKKRYYYQIFRLLELTGQKAEILNLYTKYSKLYKSQDFLDNWVLYFRMVSETNNEKMNFLATQVFARGTDNKFDVSWYFNRNIPIEKVMKFAKNDKERANILVMYSFKKIDFNLENIKKVAKYDASNNGLCFMLLREINKIEDWVLTPTYTMYLPVLREDYWENSNETRILQRSDVDRAYARQVLEFVKSIDENSVYDKHFWQLSKAYLEFITKDYKNGLQTIKKLQKDKLNDDYNKLSEIINSLLLTANQENNKAVVFDSVKKCLMKNENELSFVFAVAKELEILNNKVDAAFLISKTEINEYDYLHSAIYWKSKSGKITIHDDFYNDWYEYIDAELTTTDMQKLIKEFEYKSNTSYDFWKKSALKKNINKVNDLMAIKFMRDNNLKQAYYYFSKVSNTHYTNAPLFNENPFYKIKGYMNFDKHKNEKGLNKAKTVAQLIQLIQRANSKSNKNRSKDYFLIANCYYNMSFYGNSWMLKRISRTDNGDFNYADENEYYRCNLAKYYYQKAKQYGKSTNFDALCMYMISKCDARDKEYNIIKKHRKWDYYYDYGDEINDVNNQAFNNFITKYPNQYMDMLSNCEIFSVYYRS